jgi:hypothetical protein
MSFQEFLASIEHADLRHVAEHWATARGAKRMPAWRDIDPLQMPKQLPIVWSWRYDRRSGEFFGRLAGEAIEAIFGKSFRRAKMEKLFPPDQYPTIYERHQKVVLDPCLCRGSGRVFRHLDRFGLGERVIMPLAEDGQNGDGLFGATIYTVVAIGGEAAEQYREDVAFYDLDAASSGSDQ